MSDLDSTTLREYLSYDPETGLFTWVKRTNSSNAAGKPANSRSTTGYIRIFLCGKRHQAHRLAWLYVYGTWPTHDIDHINGQRDDNRIANLRDVPHKVNTQNQRLPRSSNPYVGVSRKQTKWVSQIQLDGKKIHLGYFSTPEGARDAYLSAKLTRTGVV